MRPGTQPHELKSAEGRAGASAFSAIKGELLLLCVYGAAVSLVVALVDTHPVAPSSCFLALVLTSVLLYATRLNERRALFLAAGCLLLALPPFFLGGLYCSCLPGVLLVIYDLSQANHPLGMAMHFAVVFCGVCSEILSLIVFTCLGVTDVLRDVFFERRSGVRPCASTAFWGSMAIGLGVPALLRSLRGASHKPPTTEEPLSRLCAYCGEPLIPDRALCPVCGNAVPS